MEMREHSTAMEVFYIFIRSGRNTVYMFMKIHLVVYLRYGISLYVNSISIKREYRRQEKGREGGSERKRGGCMYKSYL